MASELLITIGSGVLSGLIATLLTFVGIRYWKQIITPWYEDRVYKDIKITGNWETCGDEKGKNFQEIAKVYQNAHRVWGDIIYRRESNIVTYEFEGEFRNLILTARYNVKDRNDLDRGTFTLMLRNNGNLLRGFYSWYVDEENDVVSGKYEWTKTS